MKKKAVIIGAGIGGLATAVRLQAQGFNVIILEKNSTVGGKVGCVEGEGFHFDETATLLMQPELYEDTFKACDRNLYDYVDSIGLDPLFHVFSQEGTEFQLSSHFPKLIHMLYDHFPEDVEQYFKIFSDIYKKYRITEKEFLSKSYEAPSDFLNLRTLYNFGRLQPYLSTHSYLKYQIKNPVLKQFLEFQAFYVGVSPFSGPYIYLMLPMLIQSHGLKHFKGGLYSFVRALEKLFKELGGEIQLDTPVREVMIEKKKVVGVRTRKGFFPCDFVVCNADFPYAMNQLIRSPEAKGKYTAKKLERLDYSCSTFIYYLGLDTYYEHLATHNIFLNQEFKENIEAAFSRELPTNPSLYFYYPSSVDSTMAPSGKSVLSCTVRVPNLLLHEWTESDTETMKKIILEALKKVPGLSNLESHILYENCLTPLDLWKKTNTYGGAAFGILQTLSQTNYNRPQVFSPTTKGLYFVGASVHPGTGVSVVLRSSQLVVMEILKDYKRIL